jgi:predicted lipoprotein with Yx(FWY)xxD motif
MRKLIPAALGLAALALIAAGCGGGSGYGGSSSSKTTSTAAAASGAATVSTTKNKLGTILVGSNGKTLYLFEKDSGGKSTCKSGGCAGLWPPLTITGKPTAGSGVDARKLSTTAGANGAKIVTYNGHPLYFYAPDQSAGQTTGQGVNSFGAEWYVLGTNGNKLESGSAPAPSGGGGGGGGGGAY